MNRLTGLLLMTILMIAAFGCKNKPATTETISESGDTITKSVISYVDVFEVDREASSVQWKGYKPTGSHNGTIKLSFGRMAIEGKQVFGGEMTMDMQSITVNDLSGDDKARLEADLKGPNFFDAANFPTAEFKFVQIQPQDGSEGYNLTVMGNLRIKNITKELTIPANVQISSDEVRVTTPTFTLNRVEWDIKHRSGVINTIKEQLISDDIELSINLVLRPREN